MHCRLPVAALNSPHGTSGSYQSWSYRLHRLPGACRCLEQLPHRSLSPESSDPQRSTAGVDGRCATWKSKCPRDWGAPTFAQSGFGKNTVATPPRKSVELLESLSSRPAKGGLCRFRHSLQQSSACMLIAHSDQPPSATRGVLVIRHLLCTAVTRGHDPFDI